MGYFPFVTASSSGGGYPAEPVVSGTPTAGQVLTAETATTATWENSASGFANPMTTAGDLIDGGTAGAAQRLGIGSTGQGLLVVGGAPAWANTVNSVTAGDASINIGGTALAPTIETDTLNTIAANHTTDGNVGMNGFKLTGLASGSASTDSAAYGQTLAGGDLAPLTTEGDLLYANATPAPARLAIGTASGANGDFLGISGGVPAWLIPAGLLLGSTLWAPASVSSYSLGQSGFAALDTTNAIVAFTAPPSGNVLITVTAFVVDGSSGAVIWFGFLNASGGALTGPTSEVVNSGLASKDLLVTSRHLITGLSAGTSYTLQLAACASAANALVNAQANGGTTSANPSVTAAAPLTITAQAA